MIPGIPLTNNSSSTTQLLTLTLGGSASTTYPTATVYSYILPPQAKTVTSAQGYIAGDPSEYRRAPEFTLLTGASKTTISAAPPSGSVKVITGVSIPNPDTASMTMTVDIDDNGTSRRQWKATLLTGEALYYGNGKWYVIDTSGAVKTSLSANLSPITNSLGSDVNLSNTSNYFTGPSVSQGTSGTWFFSGTVTLSDTAGAAVFDVKLTDGTTVIASTAVKITAANNQATASLSGYLATPAGNVSIQAKDVTSTSGVMLFNSSGNSKDSTLTAFKIA